MTIFAGLLDRSVERIGQIAADPLRFDRGEIIEISDIWDNNTTALFAAAGGRTRWSRERRARAGLAWMADAGSSRRAWMIAQAGPGLADLLGPESPSGPYSRDYLGHVWAFGLPLDPAALAVDYDLARGAVTTFRVERAGERLDGSVGVSVPRRFGSAEAATLWFEFTDVTGFEFDSVDVRGLRLGGDDGGQVEIAFGGGGRLVARSAEVRFYDDQEWCLSRAGQAADLVTPVERPPRREPPKKLPGMPIAGVVLHRMMLEIRSVRYSRLVGKVPLAIMCEALSGAGSRIVAASASRHRDREFERLAADWLAGSPTLAARWSREGYPLGERLQAAVASAEAKTVHLVPGLRDPAEVLRADRASTRLTLVSWSTGGVTLNYAALRADGRWGIRSATSEEPIDFSVTGSWFSGPLKPRPPSDVAL
ncbi:hypothetical protein L3i22_072740 [Actinoplanes sp. L3-i22]|nr:hypothetical protein L3i22_072740 [Actinoplanes sp. L3-i22]